MSDILRINMRQTFQYMIDDLFYLFLIYFGILSRFVDAHGFEIAASQALHNHVDVFAVYVGSVVLYDIRGV